MMKLLQMFVAVSWVTNHIKMTKIANISKLPAFCFRVSDGKSVRGCIKYVTRQLQISGPEQSE